MKESFREKLRCGKSQIGTIITLPCPETAEILSDAGFDFLFIDTEHAPLSIQDVQHILQTVQHKCPCIVRAPLHNEIWIKRILDTGPDGIVVPLVNSAEEAARAVSFCRYPPEGKRSVGIARAHRYGEKFSEYIDSANSAVAVIVQAEHIDAVRNIDSIVTVKGIDGIFIGPYDLSGSMGMTGKVNTPEVREAVRKVHTTCLNAGIPAGIFGIDSDAGARYIGQKYSFIAAGMDILFLGEKAREIIEKLNK
ncbi:MAG: 2,4-dihydroxyhept-2-ene-1,7-dioic acid aldolase [Candidatus Latescibacteria bacterium]|nr:2,4-dihydroxyhept-2-ene-1,7-dioic acid aldolase [Candidatus Latescibacterota bacterium]